MNELAILAGIFFVACVAVVCLRGNSQHMADKARTRETREEWEAEKKSVTDLGCGIFVVIALLAGIFIAIATKG